MKTINVIHVLRKTDQELYENLLKINNKYCMDAKEWKQKRLRQLKKEGKNWSKKQ